MFCPQGQSKANTTNDVYWGVFLSNSNGTNGTIGSKGSTSNSSNATSEGIVLDVYCDKYQNIFGSYGFTALYTSVILVIAGFVRSLLDGNLPYIPYEMNPRPDNLLSIC